MPGSIERLRVNLPAGFDSRRHVPAVLAKISTEHGPGWEVESMSPHEGYLTVTRFAEVTETTAASSGDATRVLRLGYGTKPSDGEKIAARFEDAHPGYRLTKFEPFLGQATMTKLSDREVEARGAVANALGVKPWQVQVRSCKGGGFEVDLPGTYTASKHEHRLTEAVETVIGRPGWYVRTDLRALKATILPGELPTFEAVYTYPSKAATSSAPFVLPVGIRLGRPGVPNEALELDMSDSAGAIVQGLAGSGKSGLVNSLIYGALAAGHQLAICNVPHKAQDFEWCRDFVADHWWGCESKAEAVTVVNMVYDEGQRRGRLMRELGVQKWQELPAEVQAKHPPVTVVLDEVTGLFASDPIPKSLPKDHPVRLEAEQLAAETDLLKATVTKIPAEMRAAGIRIILATQQAQANTGIPPSVKLNLPNRVLLGPAPTKQARGHALANPDAVPRVPEHIQAEEPAARGAGVIEFEGQASAVFKAYFAPARELRSGLQALRLPKTSRPAPTPAQVDKYVPRLDDDHDEGPPSSRLSSGGGWGEVDGRDGPPPELRGAAAASRALAREGAAHACTQ